MSAGPPGGGAAGAADAAPAPAREARAGVVVANRVRRGFYLDSVALMRVSASLSEGEGVEAVSLMIGSPSNLALLDEAGLLTEEGRAAGPDDLVLAVRAEGEEALAAALDAAEEKLEGAAAEEGPERWGGAAAARLPTLRAAREALPGANLAIVSVPGPFAAREARRALAAGLHVLVFSDNVPVEEEVALKREARARGLALMGPDCGTAIVAGTPLAFANRVRRGAIGAIAASGTGLQELSVLVHRGGGGLSHGIGVGGRDLDDRVGGIGAFMALDALEADPDTRHVVIVSKPPGPRTEAALLARLAECPKPVTLCLVGRDGGELPPNVAFAPTLRDAARLALAGGDGGGASTAAEPDGSGGPAREPGAAAVPAPLPPAPPPPLPPARPGRIVGLFSGGTLCAEGQAILRRAGLPVASNAPIPGAAHLAPSGPASVLAPPQPPAPASADGHAFLDLGADEYTAGRPHPMIEPAMRSEALADTLADPTVAVVVLDVILGTGSHPDPAGPVVEVLGASAPGTRPAVVASVCGAELDPQDYGAQRRALERAGVYVAGSNADAVEAAIRIAAPAQGPGSVPGPGKDREAGSR